MQDQEIINLILKEENLALKSYENLDNPTKNSIVLFRTQIIETLKKLSDYKEKIYKCKKSKNYEDCIKIEENLCKFYKKISDEISNDELKDFVLKIWATINNEFIPALQKAQNSEFKIENFIPKDISEFLENAKEIANGNLDQNLVKKTINSPHFGLFCGIAAGGFIASILNDGKDLK